MRDPILGFELPETSIHPQVDATFRYFHPALGEVEITDIALSPLSSLDEEKKYKIAGICRNNWEFTKKTFRVTFSLLNSDLDKFNTPISFNEKRTHLVELLMMLSSSSDRPIDLDPRIDSPLIYGSPQIFQEIIESLENDGIIKIREKISYPKRREKFIGVRVIHRLKIKEEMPSLGIEKISLPFDIKNKIIFALSEGIPEEAISLLNDVINKNGIELQKQIILIQSKFNAEKKKYSLGLIQDEAFSVAKQQTIQAILNILS